MAEICIVTKDNKFEAVYHNSFKQPLNLVLEVPDSNANDKNKFLLVNTGIEVSWNNYYGTSKWNIVEVTYKNTKLFEQNHVKNVQVVIDVLNKFNAISKSELELLLQESQEKEKTALEIIIEELKKEKEKLEEQIKIYKAIQTKKEEIKSLLNKLEE
ncbi:hypothetical protein [Flavobacterium sp. UBA7682]|uniref:hypothetical protein n=1 Tax=Flavobacterium sp. UBA7682 TaxID=1946560 RepID=UPI0025C686CF|nr:hypothetical protein [Flavobacterium sp. UBA7682]